MKGVRFMHVLDLFDSRPVEATVSLSGVSGGVSQPVQVILNEEHTLCLYRDEVLLHRFVCSPASLGELCAGWLVSEGYEAASVEVSRDGLTARAEGISAAAAQPEIHCPSKTVRVCPEEMLALFEEASAPYTRSHGVHECVLKGDAWQILRTDIGRHNAIDKALGAAVLHGYDLRGAILFSSGRINVQTVRKAARCNLGCLMSKAVITHDALALARKLGLPVLFRVTKQGYLSV